MFFQKNVGLGSGVPLIDSVSRAASIGAIKCFTCRSKKSKTNVEFRQMMTYSGSDRILYCVTDISGHTHSFSLEHKARVGVIVGIIRVRSNRIHKNIHIVVKNGSYARVPPKTFFFLERIFWQDFFKTTSRLRELSRKSPKIDPIR